MQCVIGHFEADGTDVKIPIGFKPDHMRIFNQGAVVTEVAVIEWFGEEQGVAKEFHTIIIADNGSTSDENHLYQASGEIEALVETSTPAVSNGLLTWSDEWGIQLDASFMDDGDEIWYIATRADKVTDHGDINA